MALRAPAPLPALTTPAGLAPPLMRALPRDRALQRLRFHKGRNLTASALEAEQAYVMGRLGLAGRMLSPGVVRGLGVVMADQTAARGRVILEPGLGIGGDGQDVALHRPATIDLAGIPIRGAADAEGPPRGLGVLSLLPVELERVHFASEAERSASFTSTLPRDPRSAPYSDLRLLDAALAAFVPLPEALVPGDAPRARNLATEAMLRAEAEGEAPWEAGLPLALVMIAADGTILWVHRAAARRRGGVAPQPRRPGRAPPAALRQARFEGFVEHWDALFRGGWDGRDVVRHMRWLPPAGLLPRIAWDEARFFPGGWRQAQAPVPADQLDALMNAAAELAPYDLFATGEAVKWLIPVPASVYDPDLLDTAPEIDAEFPETQALLETAVADARRLRDWRHVESVRAIEHMIEAPAARGLDPVGNDPEALPGEDGFPQSEALGTPEEPQASAAADLAAVVAPLAFAPLTAAQRAMIDEAAASGADPYLGVRPFVTEMRRLADEADDLIDLGFSRLQTEIYRIRQIALDNEEATKLATFPILAGIAKGTNAAAMNEGLKKHFVATRAASAPPPSTAPGDGATTQPLMFAMLAQPLAFSTVAFATEQPPSAARFMETTSLASFQTKAESFTFERIDAGAILGAQTETNRFKAIVEQTQKGVVDDLVLATPSEKKRGILAAQPIAGVVRDIRTMTIADRLAASATVTARSSALRAKADIVTQIQNLGLDLTGVTAPLTSESRRHAVLSRRSYEAIRNALAAEDGRRLDGLRAEIVGGDDPDLALVLVEIVSLLPAPGARALTNIQRAAEALRRAQGPLAVAELPGYILGRVLDPDPEEADDEAAFLHSAVAILENAVAILRAVERRVAEVRSAFAPAAALLVRLAGWLDEAETALSGAQRDLDEARHDLRVCLSLIEEEEARLAALGARRQQILDDHVRLVAYVRPRVLAPHRAGTTSGRLLAGVRADPLPACLKEDVAPPAEIDAMLEALREAPIGWLSANPELLAVFRDPLVLEKAYLRVARNNLVRLQHAKTLALPSVPARRTTSEAAALRIAEGYRTLSGKMRTARSSLDYGRFLGASWAERRRRALADMSLNDLVESGAHVEVAKRAVAEIEGIERVATCLWARLRRAPAPVRLLWARELSTYDRVGSLEAIAKLPGWEALPIPLRQDVRRLTSWLFSRMDADPPEARAMMSDLVRVALLLASHAPAADIVAAHVEREQTVETGGVLDLTIARGVPKIGMIVKVYAAEGLQVSGVVRDVIAGRVRIEAREVTGGLRSIATTSRVTIHAASARALAWS